MVVKRPIALKCATGFNPKNVYGPKDQRPLTRMGIAQIMIDLLLDGQQYMEKKQLAAEGKGEAPDYNSGLELVEKVLRREIPLKMHSGGFDMLTGIEIANRFNVLLTCLLYTSLVHDFYSYSATRFLIYGKYFYSKAEQLSLLFFTSLT